jgi:hypothetical protein
VLGYPRRIVKSTCLLLLCLFLTACNRDRYRVVERIDRFVDKQGRQVADKWYDGLAYDHEEVSFVLKHGGSRIHATCDLSTLDKLDPNASCGLRPLREYACTAGRGDRQAPMPLSDLVCTDSDGRKVYLYVSKEEQ